MKYTRRDVCGLNVAPHGWGDQLLRETHLGQLKWKQRMGVWIARPRHYPNGWLLLWGHKLVLRLPQRFDREITRFPTPLESNYAGQLLEAIIFNQEKS